MIFHSFQHIPHLACKYYHCWKKFVEKHSCIWLKKIDEESPIRLAKFSEVPSSLLATVKYKNDHNSINRKKSENLFFICFSTFRILHVNINPLKKNLEFFFCLSIGKFLKNKSRGWIFYLGLVDPSGNRLASTAYFAIVSSLVSTHGSNACIIHQIIICFFKSGQIYMEDTESAESKENQISDFSYLWSILYPNFDEFFSW